jgi:type IV secretory pathway component VirB8
MNADIVHSVAQALPFEELERLYLMIQKDIGAVKVVKKVKKAIITEAESMDVILKHLNRAKKTRLNK